MSAEPSPVAITGSIGHKIDAEKPHGTWECSAFRDSVLTQVICARNLPDQTGIAAQTVFAQGHSCHPATVR
jgi:hypothetical protein